MRNSLWIPIVAVCGLLAALPVGLQTASAEGKANRSDVLSVEDLRPGMKGYGLTVFEGTEPSKFDVEIIDVLENFRPRQELILVKTYHPRLEAAKVVAGMSGSPIYIDGKMIGAYAYGWSFGAEPVAGVTPIRNMLDDLARPLPDFIHGWPLTPEAKRQSPLARRGGAGNPVGSRYATLGSTQRFAGAPGKYDLEMHRAQLAASHRHVFGTDMPGTAMSASDGDVTSALTPVSTPVLLGGMSPASVELARELLGPLGLVPLQAGGGGGTDPNAPTRFVDGGAIGVQLIRGDINAMGLGTVTRVEGDKLLAFGHPMMNGGVTAMPTAIAKVLWFLASQSRSFKIGMPVRSVGALVNDRQASIVVSHSATAPTIDVVLDIEGVPGAPYEHWQFEVAHEKFMAPSLLAVALGNALQSTAADRQDVSWNASSRVKFHGFGEVALEDFGVSVGGTPDQREFIGSNLVGAVGSVLNNPWEPAFVESVNIKMTLRYAREIYRLEGAEVLDPEVEAGEAARIRVALQPFAGPRLYKTLKLPVPRHLAGEKLKVDVRPGYMVEKPRATPQNLRELIRSFEDPIYPPKSVVLSYVSGGGMTHQNHVAMNLPPGVLDAVSSQTSGLTPEEIKTETHYAVELPQFMTGRAQVTVQVKPIIE